MHPGELYMGQDLCGGTNLFTTCCVMFAVIWCVKNKGRIKDCFVIDGTGITYATIMLGAHGR